MKRLLFILLVPFNLISMQYPKDYHRDISYKGWPQNYIDDENKKKNLTQMVEYRIRNNIDLDLPIIIQTHTWSRPFHIGCGTPLCEACWSDYHLEVTQKLLDNRANPNICFGAPLRNALAGLALETVKTLIKAGADVNAKSALDGMPVKSILWRWPNRNMNVNKQLLEVLLGNGADLQERNRWDIFSDLFKELDSKKLSKPARKSIALLLEYGFKVPVGLCEDVELKPKRIKDIKNLSKRMQLLRLLRPSREKGHSPFQALPKEIVKIIARFVHPKK